MHGVGEAGEDFSVGPRLRLQLFWGLGLRAPIANIRFVPQLPVLNLALAGGGNFLRRLRECRSMARLEDLTRSASVKGILPDGLVTVIDVK